VTSILQVMPEDPTENAILLLRASKSISSLVHLVLAPSWAVSHFSSHTYAQHPLSIKSIRSHTSVFSVPYSSLFSVECAVLQYPRSSLRLSLVLLIVLSTLTLIVQLRCSLFRNSNSINFNQGNNSGKAYCGLLWNEVCFETQQSSV
jgi:hypothetical protein